MALSRQDIDKRVIPKFFEHSKKLGFTAHLEEYLESVGTDRPLKLWLAPQMTIIKEFLYLTFEETRGNLDVSIVRQLGKTEVFAHLVSFCLKYFQYYLKKEYCVVVLAPEKNTGTVIFDRICQYMPEGFFNKKNRGLQRMTKTGDSIEVFSLYEDGGSTFEGRTIKLVIRDEAHLGSDIKYKDQVRPTLIRTNGFTVNIGNGGYKQCLFYDNIKRGSSTDTIKIGGVDAVSKNVIIRRDYDQLRSYMTMMAQQGVKECFDWLHGVEQEIRDSGINSIEIRKNIFCQWMLTVNGFLSREEVLKKFGKCKWDGISPIFASVDVAKHRDRTIVFFANEHRHVFDMIVLKQANERKEIMQQFEELREYCDDSGYTPFIEMIGGDATGMGEAAIEILEQAMPSEIVEYKFTLKDKHKWYTGLQSRFLTENEAESILMSEDIPEMEEIIKELTQLEVKSTVAGDYLRFAAPEKTGYFDDIVASLAIINDMVSRYGGYRKQGQLYSDKFPSKVPKVVERSNEMIVTQHNSPAVSKSPYMSSY